ncbi:MAG: hypothetical protein JSW52_01470 [Candidatus Coatesbacteria bacterium]|nr:MAG: hypothetical protein JSW52_01470 [Candidatus Coatesbacteria bacterium]
MKTIYLLGILTITLTLSASARTIIVDTDGTELGRVRDDGTITNGDFDIGEIDTAAGVVYDSAGGTMGYLDGGIVLNAGRQVVGYYEDPEGRILDANRAVIAKLKDDGEIVNDVGVEVGRWRGEKDARAVAVFAFFFNRFI